MPTHRPPDGRRAGADRPEPLRSRRVAETIKRLVTAWLEQEQQREDRPGFVTVTDVRVSRDLGHARVYYTLLGPEPTAALRGGADATAPAATNRLAEVTPQVRAWVAQHLRVRHAPTIEFVPDDVAASGARIERILDDLSGTHDAGTGTGGDVTDPTDPAKGSQA